MNELIPVTDERLAEYEQLLIKRDSLRKEAGLIYQEYYKQFGELLIRVYEKQVECIKLKKMISFAQTAINKNEKLDLDKLNAYLDEVMIEYRKKLEEMRQDHKKCIGAKYLGDMDIMKIKKIYRDIVKKLHPDISDLMDKDDRLKELWVRANEAYSANDLEALEEAYAQIQLILAGMGETGEIHVSDIEDKILALKENIEEITHSPPYTLKPYISDPIVGNEKRIELEGELDKYMQYNEQLKDILKKMTFGMGLTIEVDGNE